MAGKNEVQLTFAGDASKLDRELKKVEQSTKGAETAFDDLGRAAKRSDDALDGFDGRVRGLDRAIGTGGRAFGDYGKGLGGVGDRFDELDTRAMGLADGFAGLADASKWSSLTLQEQAMVASDLGSSMYNAVIPSLQSAGKAMKGLNFASLAVTGGIIAGAAALTAYAFTSGKAEVGADAVARALRRTDDASKAHNETSMQTLEAIGQLDDVFGRVLESQPQMADEFIATAEAAGVSNDELQDMRDRLADVAETSDYTADSIKGVAEALAAQSDPVFGAINALEGMRDANADVTAKQFELLAAVDEFGAGSAEAIEAAHGLRDAEIAAGEAAFGQEQALLSLGAAMIEQGFSVSDIETRLRTLAAQTGLSEGAVNTLIAELYALPENVHTTLNAHDLASYKIENVRSTIEQLDGASATVRLTAMYHTIGSAFGLGRADGGIIPDYAATGMIAGPKGTDTIPAWLTPGEVVLNADQQANTLWAIANGAGAGGGGQAPINVYVQGSIRSDRELVGVIADAIDRGALAR